MEQQIRFLVENYYDIQKLRVEAFNRLVAYVKSQITHETHLNVASHITVEPHTQNASQSKIETQKTLAKYDKRYATQATKLIKTPEKDLPQEIKDLIWYHNSLHETEKQIAKRLDNWSSHHKLRIHFLSQTKGIGPILSSGLIAWLTPISRFDNISKLWKFCGLAPNQKRRKGEKLNYNPHLKTLMWKIASSFEKQKPQKCVYREHYDEKKKYLLDREDLAKAIKDKIKGAKLHVRLLAMRFTSKRFLADLWVQWRKLENLPTTEPYAIAILKHDKE